MAAISAPPPHIEPVPGSPAVSYHSQAARRAARSSRVTLGDLAGLPLLMNAPCSHLTTVALGRRVVAANAQLIAVQVPEICTIVVGMVVWSQARFTFASRAIRDGSRVAPINSIPVRSEQCHHLPIARCSAFTVVRTADKEKRPIQTGLHPAGHCFSGSENLSVKPSSLITPQ